MKPVEEIAREIIENGSTPPVMQDEIAAALRAERERAVAALALVGIRTDAAHEALARAEKAEAELHHLKETEGVEWLSTPTIDRLQAAEERAEKAEAERDAALATARDRALEEAAECVKDCRQWEPECPHAARILSLRIPEAST